MKKEEKKYDFYLADLKKFDVEANGFEFDSSISKGFFVRVGDKFINPFDPFDERSVYARSNCYGEYSESDQFGTKLVLANGSGYDEYAWILSTEVIFADLQEIENFILYSNKFFKDRINIASKRLVDSNDLHEKYRMYRILEKDSMYLDEKKKSSKKLIK